MKCIFKCNRGIKYLLLSFFVPIVLLLVHIVILQFLNPDQNLFSPKQILIMDMGYQYLSFFNYFKNVLLGNESLFYSFSNLLGGNTFAIFSYYLSSPLNLMLFFVPVKNIVLFVYILMFIKFGLCGLTMYIFLNYMRPNKNFYSFLFALFYALMGYNLTYYTNIMWLDVVYLAPICLMGINKIVHNQKGYIYVFSLSLSIISNFYISYMLAIFIVMYFIYEMVINYSKCDKLLIKKVIKNFLCCTLLAVLISSFILVPTVVDLQNVLRFNVKDSMYINNNYIGSFFTFLTRLYMLPQFNMNLASKFTPNVYFGILPLLFLVSYFFGKVSKKEKIISIFIIGLFVISFCTNIFNLLWHGFTYPNGYNYRFSFLFSLFCLILAFKSITNDDVINTSKFSIFGSILILIDFLCSIFCYVYWFNEFNVSLTVLFILNYYQIFTMLKGNIKKAFLLLFVLLELYINVYNNFFTATETNKYYNVSNLCDVTEKFKSNNYRIDNYYLESFICGIKSISGSGTSNNKNVYNFMHNMGYNVTISTVTNNDNTALINSVLGLRYYINYDDNNYVLPVNLKTGWDYFEQFYLHENQNALTLGFITKYSDKNTSIDNSNVFENQNNFIKALSGLDDEVLKPFQLKKIDTNTYEAIIDNDEDIYIYVKYPIVENKTWFANLKINNDQYTIDTFNSGVFKIDNKYNKKNLKITLDINKDIKKHLSILRRESFKIDKIQGNYLKGQINNKEKGTLFLSIPYEAGWNIYVDGRKTNYFDIFDTFIGIELELGNHSIEMKFYSPGSNIGFVLSLVGIACTIFYFKKSNIS